MESRLAFVAASLFLAALCIAHAWPVSWWLDLRSLVVADGRTGQPVVVSLDRTIKRPFFGTSFLTVKRWDADGWVTVCPSEIERDFDPEDATPATLDKFTRGKCGDLEPGRYQITFRVLIQGGLLPDKSDRIDSNIFTIEAPRYATAPKP